MKFLSGINKKSLNSNGQAVVEYLLIVAVVLGIFMVIARPGIGNLGKKIQDSLNKGMFSSDSTGSGFYYFPIK